MFRTLHAPLLTLAGLALAIVTSTAALTTHAGEASAAACLSSHTHWGRMSDTRMDAKSNAFAGMDWKLRVRIPQVMRLERGIRIRQCKWRGNEGLWQCQAAATVNHCS